MGASSNWLALQKTLKPSPRPRKRRKIAGNVNEEAGEEDFPRASGSQPKSSTEKEKEKGKGEGGGEEDDLIKLIKGTLDDGQTKTSPSHYISLDCEMVGIGPNGSESSLARVSIVDYNGIVLLDTYVTQRENVTDYRTPFSGIRARDLVPSANTNCASFAEVQTQVASLLKDKTLIGHALTNDFTSLLLSHPSKLTRDTQKLAWKNGLVGTKRAKLRDLVRIEFGVEIQGGEHDSVTDARATMALFRKWMTVRKWDVKSKSPRPTSSSSALPLPLPLKRTKRKRDEGEEEEEEEEEEKAKVKEPEKGKRKGEEGQGRKGISSGLSTIITRKGTPKAGGGAAKGRSKPGSGGVQEGGKGGGWWKALPS